MNSASKEQRVSSENDERDRLSELPDEILVHILSFLPIVDAVRTLVIRRFGHLWTLLPSLKFLEFHCSKAYNDGELDDEDEPYVVVDDVDNNCCRRFANFLRNALILHKSTPVDVLRISFCSGEGVVKTDARKFANCIRFAVDKQVKELIVVFNRFIKPPVFVLPSCLFTSEFLVTLKLSSCPINELSQVQMRSLRELSLCNVVLSNETFNKIMLGSCSLQELDLSYVRGLNEVRFTNPSVEKLKLASYSGLLDCPNLKVLEFISFSGEPMEVVNVSSIRTVNIKRCNSVHVFYECLKAFRNAERFEFSCDLFLSSIIEHDLPQTRWKRLHILSQLLGDEFLGICRVLRSSPDLQELVVHTRPQQYPDEDIEGSQGTNMLSRDLPSCLMQQLKTVIMQGNMVPCHSLLQLAEYLLRICVNLEKMVILPGENKSSSTGEELCFVKQLLSFPRASTNARVIFGSEVY